MDAGEKYSEDELRRLERKYRQEYEHAAKTAKERFLKEMESFTKRDEAQRVRLDSGEITQEQYDAWRNKAILPALHNREMMETLSKQMGEANERARAALDGTLAGVYAENANYAAFDICKRINVAARFDIYDESTVNRLLKDGDVRLLPKSKRDIPKDLRWNQQKITAEITQGILNGESIPKISKRLANVAAMNANAAVRNARTAVTSAQNAGRMDSYNRAADMGIKIKKRWVATLDSRTRDSHIRLDGETVEINEAFSNGLQYPGDPDGAPSEVYNCRCTMITEIEGFPHDMTQRFSRLNGMTYEEWKQRGHL